MGAVFSRLDRYFPLIAAALLALMGAAQTGSAIQESATNDEPIHLTAGYVYLTTGHYRMDPTHPPLARVLAALPLLGLRLHHIPADRAWLEFTNLVWQNTVPAQVILLRARLMIVALTLCFGAWLAWWTRRRFGAPIALLALLFFVFDPNLIAHGHYVTTDLAASFGIFAACTMWADFLEAPSPKRLILAAVTLGLALLTKFSALFLLAVLPILFFLVGEQRRNLRAAIRTFLVLYAGAAMIIGLAYAPEIWPTLRALRSHRSAPPTQFPAEHDNFAVKTLLALNRETGLLAFPYLGGAYELLRHNAAGNQAYLLGQVGQFGWWNYFPVAVLVKTPTGVLLAGLLALAAVVKCRNRPPPVLLCLAVPPISYFLLVMASSIDIGLRHVLPVYPFLYVLIAFALIHYGPGLLRRAFPWVLAGLIALVAAESIAIYPHDLAFFNWPSGGPVHGPDYLLDSNIDWGQDYGNLEKLVEQRHLTPLCTALFGSRPDDSMLTAARDLRVLTRPINVQTESCVVAVSVNNLRGLFMPPEIFAPLLNRKPLARVGYSIYVYDLRH